MRTLVIASQKGGVGKTTIAGHLGVMAEAKGAGPVALIDTDPQGSLASWWNERQAEAPAFASVDIANLPGHLKQLEKAGVKLAIIDTPPAVTDTIHQAEAPARAAAKTAAPDYYKALTVKLDRERYEALKTLGVKLDKKSQEIFVEALDLYLQQTAQSA